jgi:hypothetical protein
MELLKNELPSALISGAIGLVIEKYVLGHNLTSSDKFLGISIPKYGSTLLTVGSGSVIGGALSGVGNKYLPNQVSSLSKPLIGGLSVSGMNYLNHSNTNMINSFAMGAGSIYGGELIDNKILKKKSLTVTPNQIF